MLVFLSGEREIRDTAEALRPPRPARASSSSRSTPASRPPSSTACSRRTPAAASCSPPTSPRRRSRCPGSSASSTRARRASPGTTAAPRCSASRSRRISQASAAQRAGRCGRVAPGHRASACTRRRTSTPGPSSPSPRSCARTWRRSSSRWPPSAWATSPPSRSSSLPTPAASRTGSCCSRSSGALDARAGPTGRPGAGSPSSAGGWPGSPPTRGWPGWSSRPTATASWARCSCSRPPCRSRTRGSGRPARRTRPPRTTAASPTPTPTSWPTSTSGATCGPSRRSSGSSAFRRMCRREHLHHLRIREWQDVHSQLRQVALGIGLAGRAARRASPTGRASTGRCWRGCSRTSGCSTRTATSTAARARPASSSRPGTASGAGARSGSWPPSWWRRTACALAPSPRSQPGDIEHVAAHLVTRSYEDPWWDEARGEAMTTERVSLYGLPVVTGRRVRGRPGRPGRAPGRCSCATRSWTATGMARGIAFVRANQERVADVVALEQRVRRDLLVGDDDAGGVLRPSRAGRGDGGAPLRHLVEGRRAGRSRSPHLPAVGPHRSVRRPARSGRLPGDAGRSVTARLPVTYVLDPSIRARRGGRRRPVAAARRGRARRARVAGARPAARPGDRADPVSARRTCGDATPRSSRRPRRCSSGSAPRTDRCSRSWPAP